MNVAQPGLCGDDSCVSRKFETWSPSECHAHAQTRAHANLLHYRLLRHTWVLFFDLHSSVHWSPSTAFPMCRCHDIMRCYQIFFHPSLWIRKYFLARPFLAGGKRDLDGDPFQTPMTEDCHCPAPLNVYLGTDCRCASTTDFGRKQSFTLNSLNLLQHKPLVFSKTLFLRSHFGLSVPVLHVCMI